MNRANLEKLATYLEALPDGYGHFSMCSYLQKDDRHIYMVEEADSILHDCGTVACAVGHGPAAGIEPTPYENWDDYTDRVFDLPSDAWAWCFSSDWVRVDNTPQGAAKRIRYMLAHGLPENSNRQKNGRSPYMFESETA